MDKSLLQGMIRAHVFNPKLAQEGRVVPPLPPKPVKVQPQPQAQPFNNSLSFLLAVTNTPKQ